MTAITNPYLLAKEILIPTSPYSGEDRTCWNTQRIFTHFPVQVPSTSVNSFFLTVSRRLGPKYRGCKRISCSKGIWRVGGGWCALNKNSLLHYNRIPWSRSSHLRMHRGYITYVVQCLRERTCQQKTGLSYRQGGCRSRPKLVLFNWKWRGVAVSVSVTTNGGINKHGCSKRDGCRGWTKQAHKWSNFRFYEPVVILLSVLQFIAYLSLSTAQYLSSKGYTRTLATFESECEQRSSQGALSSISSNSSQAELLTAFECGEREAFCQLWEEHVPAHLRSRDPTCQHLECSVNVYFAVYPIRTGVRNMHNVSMYTHTHTPISLVHWLSHTSCRPVTRSSQWLHSEATSRAEQPNWPTIKISLHTLPYHMFRIFPNILRSKTSSWYMHALHDI